MQSFMESKGYVVLLAPSSDRYNGDPQSNTLDMDQIHRATVIIEEGDSTGGSARVVLNACTGSTGAGATAIGYRYKTHGSAESTWSDWTTVTSSGALTSSTEITTGDFGLALQFSAKDIVAAGSSATFRWAQIALTESANTPVAASVVAVVEPRYYGAVIADVVDSAS